MTKWSLFIIMFLDLDFYILIVVWVLLVQSIPFTIGVHLCLSD